MRKFGDKRISDFCKKNKTRINWLITLSKYLFELKFKARKNKNNSKMKISITVISNAHE